MNDVECHVASSRNVELQLGFLPIGIASKLATACTVAVDSLEGLSLSTVQFSFAFHGNELQV